MLQLIAFLKKVKNVITDNWKVFVIIVSLLFVVGILSYSINTAAENKQLHDQLVKDASIIKLQHDADKSQLTITQDYLTDQINGLDVLYTEYVIRSSELDANYVKTQNELVRLRSLLYKDLVKKGKENPNALTCELATELSITSIKGCPK